jgi:hypothetical protein
MLRRSRKWPFYTRFVCFASAEALAKHTKRVLQLSVAEGDPPVRGIFASKTLKYVAL